MTAPIRTVWIIRESALGDVILCEPVLAALAARHPEAAVTLVTRAAYHPLFADHPARPALVTTAEARQRPPPDLVIDLQNRLRTRRLGWGARHRRHWRKRRGLHLLAPWRLLHPSYRGGPHQLERLAAAAGLPGPLRPPELPPRSEARRAVEAWLPPGPRVVLAPGAAHAAKRWPLESFQALAQRLAARGLAVVVVGGPGEGPLVEGVAQGVGTAVPVTVPLDVVAAVLASAGAVVGGDTGLLHLASAVGTPAIALFGPTAPGRWGPPAGRGVAVARDLPCAPCSDYGQRRCPLGTYACLRGLTVGTVEGEVIAWHKATQRLHPP